jgi:hypothetical protein
MKADAIATAMTLAIAVDFEKAFGMIVGRERDGPANSH